MWRTEQDVINDVQQVTGIRMRVDENYVARGGRPPPRNNVFEDDYDDYRLRFGDTTATHEVAAPDLAGITQMLRMVDISQSTKHKQSVEPVETKKTSVVISKLNPDVKEFVPLGGFVAAAGDAASDVTATDITSTDITATDITSTDVTSTDVTASGDTATDVTDTDITATDVTATDGTVTRIDDEEKNKRLIYDLHKTIGENRDESSLAHKKARNVALATLLKLHSSPSPSSTTRSSPCVPEVQQASVTPTPLVLLTPDYYAGAGSSTLEENTKEQNGASPIFTPKSSPSPRDVVDPYIKESVQKVEKWLDIPEKKAPEKKTPEKKTKPKLKLQGPYTGPIVFRKKCSPKNTSPQDSEKSTKVNQIPQFVPTEQAEIIRRDMEEKIKIKEENNRKKLNMWEKLEFDLKERDRAIKEKLRAQTAQTLTANAE